MMTYSFFVTGAAGGEVKVTGEPKAVDAVERALSLAGATFNSQVETWDFGYYSKPTTRPIYKIAGDIIAAQAANGRVPAVLVDELAKAVIDADHQVQLAEGGEHLGVSDAA